MMDGEPEGVSAGAFTMLPGGNKSGIEMSDVFNADKVSLEHVYNVMMLNKSLQMGNSMKTAVCDAVSVCMLVMGSSKSRKRDAFQGPYTKRPVYNTAPSAIGEDQEMGLAGLVTNDLFATLAAKKVMPQEPDSSCAVCVRFVELYDELITDLLCPPATNTGQWNEESVVFIKDTSQGTCLRGACAPRVHSAEDALKLIRRGRSRRNDLTATHAASDAACYLELELHHLTLTTNRLSQQPNSPILTEEELTQGWKCAAVSKISLLEVPSTEKLAVPREQLVIQEGSSKNLALLTLASCIQELCKSPTMRKTLPSQDSNLTRLIAGVLEGDGLLISLAFCALGDSPEALSAVLKVQRQLENMRQFPVSQIQTHVTGLTMRHRAQLSALRETLNVKEGLRGGIEMQTPASSDGPLRAFKERLEALEHSLAESRLDAVSARQDSIKIYKVLEFLRHKYTNLAELKAEQANELASTQQAKLEISKALLEAKLQNCRHEAETKSDTFVSKSELLVVKDEAAALAIQCDMLKAAGVQAGNQVTLLLKKLDQTRADLQRSRIEASKGKERCSTLEEQFNKLQSRNIELSAELLKIVSQRDELYSRVRQKERLALRAIASKTEIESMFEEKTKKNDELMKAVGQMRIEAAALQAAHVRARAQLEHARMDVGRALLDRDCITADLQARKQSEIMGMKQILHEGMLKLRAIKGDQESARLKAIEDSQVASGHVRQLEIALDKARMDMSQIERDRGTLINRIYSIEGSFRARLGADLAAAIRNHKNKTRNQNAFSSSTAAFVRQFVDSRAPICSDSLSVYYEGLMQNFRSMETTLLQQIEYSEKSEKKAVAQFKLLHDYCLRLHGVLADHAPAALNKLQKNERCDLARLEADTMMGLERQREKNFSALAQVRSQMRQQQEHAISAIRDLQSSCNKEQARRASAIQELHRLEDNNDRREAELKARQDIALSSLQAARTSQTLGMSHPGQRENKGTLARIEALQQQIVDDLEQRNDKVKPQQNAKVRQALASARQQVERLHRHINVAAVSSFDEISKYSEERVLAVEETKINLLRRFEALSSESTDVIKRPSFKSEMRCIQLSYRVAILEEELKQYREYMRKTVRRYQPQR